MTSLEDVCAEQRAQREKEEYRQYWRDCLQWRAQREAAMQKNQYAHVPETPSPVFQVSCRQEEVSYSKPVQKPKQDDMSDAIVNFIESAVFLYRKIRDISSSEAKK